VIDDIKKGEEEIGDESGRSKEGNPRDSSIIGTGNKVKERRWKKNY